MFTSITLILCSIFFMELSSFHWHRECECQSVGSFANWIFVKYSPCYHFFGLIQPTTDMPSNAIPFALFNNIIDEYRDAFTNLNHYIKNGLYPRRAVESLLVTSGASMGALSTI